MEKQIILQEKDFDELERKARLFENNSIEVTFAFKGFGVDDKVSIIRKKSADELINEGVLCQMDAIINHVQARHNDYVADIKQRISRGLYDDKDAKVAILEMKLDKIPNWVKRIFL